MVVNAHTIAERHKVDETTAKALIYETGNYGFEKDHPSFMAVLDTLADVWPNTEQADFSWA